MNDIGKAATRQELKSLSEAPERSQEPTPTGFRGMLAEFLEKAHRSSQDRKGEDASERYSEEPTGADFGCLDTYGRKIGYSAPEPAKTADLIEKLKRLKVKKSTSEMVARELRSRGLDHVADRLSRCGSYVALKDYLESEKISVSQANWCNLHKLCPMCAHYRGVNSAKVLSEKISQVVREQKLIPVLVTWTIKNGPDLEERFQHLKTSIKKYFKSVRNAREGRRKPLIGNHFEGGAEFIEIIRGKWPNWHPHCHAIYFIKPGALKFYAPKKSHRGRWVLDSEPYRQFVSEWERVTGDSKMVSMVLPQSSRQIMNGKNPDDVDFMSETLEASKYITKFLPGIETDLIEIHEKTYRKHLRYMRGCLRGLKLPEDPADLEIADLDYWLREYSWNHNRYQHMTSHLIKVGVDTEPKT